MNLMDNLDKQLIQDVEPIKNILKECGIQFSLYDNILFIQIKNPNYKPDDGSNPYLATKFEDLDIIKR